MIVGSEHMREWWDRVSRSWESHEIRQTENGLETRKSVRALQNCQTPTKLSILPLTLQAQLLQSPENYFQQHTTFQGDLIRLLMVFSRSKYCWIELDIIEVNRVLFAFLLISPGCRANPPPLPFLSISPFYRPPPPSLITRCTSGCIRMCRCISIIAPSPTFSSQFMPPIIVRGSLNYPQIQLVL